MDIATLRILVVEDHQFQRWLATAVLREAGATAIFAASDGREALELLATIDPPIDVVVSDLDMPGMDGMELVRKIAAHPRRAALVIVTSMEPKVAAAVETMARAYGVSLLGTIHKPLTARKFTSVIAGYTPAAPVAVGIPITADEVAQGLRERQFEALFQPKVEVRTGKLVGAETLGRWNHPRMGFLDPAYFIEVAESAGLMDSLTDSMVRGAAQGWHEWQRAGFEASVSVNLSISSMTDPSFADRIYGVVREERLDPAQMTFEVTESLATSDLAPMLENLSRLRIRGFGLSLDDYGTGYSSMQRLSRVPFTELKIDGSFVKGAAIQPHCRAMVESSLELAQKLRIDAVAEGVETRSEWELVLALGCPVAQGYYVGRPMVPLEFIEWALARKQDSA